MGEPGGGGGAGVGAGVAVGVGGVKVMNGMILVTLNPAPSGGTPPATADT